MNVNETFGQEHVRKSIQKLLESSEGSMENSGQEKSHNDRIDALVAFGLSHGLKGPTLEHMWDDWAERVMDARNAALEEAAKLCESLLASWTKAEEYSRVRNAYSECIAAIRAMKT